MPQFIYHSATGLSSRKVRTTTLVPPDGGGGSENTGSNPTGSSDIIAARVRRLQTGSGNILVSSGFPLQEGQLFSNNLNNVRVLVEGVEKQIYIEALSGSHSDGSLRSILIQFTHSIPTGSALSAEVRLNEARTTTDISKTTINSQGTMPPTHPSRGISMSTPVHALYRYGFPLAAILPTSVNHLIACDMTLPMLPRDTEFALGGHYARRIRDFESGSMLRWQGIWSSTTLPNTPADVAYDANYYDRPLGYFAHYFATANEELYYRQACSYHYAHRELYAHPANYQYDPYHSFCEGPMIYYWLTGDPEARNMVAQQGTFYMATAFVYDWDVLLGSRHAQYQDPRNMAYAVKAWLCMYRLGYVTAVSRQDGRTFNLYDKVTEGMNKMMGTGTYSNDGVEFPSHPLGESPMYQSSGTQNGVWAQGLDAACPTVLTLFMQGGLVPDVMIKCYRWHNADSRVPVVVKKAIDWVWDNHWRRNEGDTDPRSAYAFDYLTGDCSGEGHKDAEQLEQQPDLNLLYIANYAWIGMMNNSQTYYTRSLDILSGSQFRTTDISNDVGSSFGKQFNQQQSLAFPTAKYIWG